ncbi:MAG: hypothetical protein DRQ48_00800 [Gammaproteobacteria bacterium]|nr:MAG: hypothetical protein DRQ44_00570 [Gammaproteobacteria bacterium]RKZ72217.1 MAG: hypothetical protein DRQ48_00800 [Gammaproteobacteria bacterium]
MDIPRFLAGEYQQDYHRQLNEELTRSVGDLGFRITQATSADITALTQMSFRPVLPVGTMWFDTDLAKLVVLVVAAVPGVSDGIIETIQSI